MGRSVRELVLVAVIFVSACGSNTGGPTPPPAPQLTCPAGISVSGVLGGSQSVTYTPPSATGGAAPVNISCAPPSGSSFPVGTNNVTCTAFDAQNRQAACSFTVTL